MLSDRINALFELLQCNNTEIARYAGCSSGNISKLKTGNRAPKPSSRSVASLAEGVYGYSDYENLLPVLADLCGAADTGRETLIPALIAWLYDTETVSLPRGTVTPKSKRARNRQRHVFGEKLDRAMSLLSLSNVHLAALLNVDSSLISRYRSGIYSPHGNAQLSERLGAVLAASAQKSEKLRALAELCGTNAADLNADAVTAWLYDASQEEDRAAMGGQFLRSLDAFVPGAGLPASVPEAPDVPVSSRYEGTEGLRAAVVRFLSDAAREGGELLLYSDEPTDWMTSDRAYFALWASLMARCVNGGVKIRIIHNIDRDGAEMVDAIRGWFPLYVSGMIEPYVFGKERNPRFHHTVFLRPGKACILGFFPTGAGNDRSYDYVTDGAYLTQLEREFGAMLSSASPFLKVYSAGRDDGLYRDWIAFSGVQEHLLTGFPIATAPEPLMARILSRADISSEERAAILSLHRDMRSRFLKALGENSVSIVLCLTEEGEKQKRPVNFALGLTALDLSYTREEFAEHLAAVIELVRNERNFHLTLLPRAPFQDIQIITKKDAVAVIRSREPYAAFVFSNPALTESVSAFLSMAAGPYEEDRRTVIEALEKLM